MEKKDRVKIRITADTKESADQAAGRLLQGWTNHRIKKTVQGDKFVIHAVLWNGCKEVKP